ncbi:deazaflavin-dependent oxidoreductase (nitroreductase family) [Amycolatopsis echigonensis]|uniref:Deazaflavin-dependent oxidoreductase (Nitroreductase family) n=1 Tax=Amycolatopsis echigonensis TaxID=2576905 RepID=A0A2N3WJ34_9PSEU|nr:nitroreductase family deazaflavin-dependent oxidoreductase [Amycolatopsis niigatensis]PKV93879.1 deazaflavin-dependent oxidoreductase (nitroreductase family) [Amycolatopsis niigatensis]
MSDWNQQIIDEFRANAGKVGGMFEGRNMLLLTHTGAKSGKQRVSPLVYTTDGDRIVIAASKGGADTNPDWYHNLVANPSVTVEIGTEKFPATAKLVADRAERDRLYAGMVAHAEGFADYEKKTERVIPVFVLER